MTQTNVRVQMQIRRDTAANWSNANPTPLAGELCYETDTGKIKVGTGSDSWIVLPYAFLPLSGGSLTDHLTIHNKKELRLSDATASTAGDHYSAFKAGTQSANLTYTLPTSLPASSGQVLSCTDAGVMSWASDSTTDNTKMPLAGGTFSGSVIFDGTTTIRGDQNSAAILDLKADEGDDASDIWQVKAEGDNSFYITYWNGSAYEASLQATAEGETALKYNNLTKLATKSAGVEITGDVTATGNLATAAVNITDNSPSLIFTDSAADSDFRLRVQSGVFKIRDDTNSADRISINSTGAVTIPGNAVVSGSLNSDDFISEGYIKVRDDEKIYVGEGNDLEIHHQSSTPRNRIDSGGVRLDIDSNDLRLRDSGGESYIHCINDGAVELYWDGDGPKLETESTGCKINGSLEITSNLIMSDSDIIKLGNSNDLQIFHDGTDSFLSAGNDGRAGYVSYILNEGNNSDRYGIRIQCGADNASGTNYAISIGDGNNTFQGAITFSGGTVTYGAFTAHHPCIVPDLDNPSDSSNAYPYGTLLETIGIEYTQKNGSNTERGIRYKVQKTQSANSKKVLGAYGSSMNGGPDGQTNEHQALVLGDGHILVNNAGGNIEIGDGICSSAAAGIGQKATANPSMIIGIAQEAITFTGSETKLVAVQYGLQQFTPWS